MKLIKEYQVTILIVFIIASILYGIHMFRYEFIYMNDNNLIIRYDRITNTQCVSIRPLKLSETRKGYSDHINGKFVYDCDKK